MGDTQGTRMARPKGKKGGKKIEPPAPEQIERAADAVATGAWVPSDERGAKVLFLVANSTEAPVNAEVEEREIRDQLKQGRQFGFEKVPDVRAEDLFSVMRSQQPAIVHFSGHGYGADGLAMKNRDGKPTSITARELNLHFQNLAKQGIAVRTVVLNACLAEAQAQAIAPYVDYVVGTSTLVGDETAVTFAANFYQGLMQGMDVRSAFESARARCGGDVEGTERIFRLFYSEPAEAQRPKWAPLAIVGVVALLAAIVAFVATRPDAPEPTPAPATAAATGGAEPGATDTPTPRTAEPGGGAIEPPPPPSPKDAALPPPDAALPAPVLTGTVALKGDATKLLAGAKVTTDPATDAVLTDEKGRFRIEKMVKNSLRVDVEPGAYTVKVELKGYKPFSTEGPLELELGSEPDLAISLEPLPKKAAPTVICARDQAERANFVVRNATSCCPGKNSRLSSAQKNALGRGCTQHYYCSSIPANCRVRSL